MTEILKILGWLLFSAVKFLIAPGSIYIIGHYSYWETIAISIAGGWIGVSGFFYFGKIFFSFFEWISNRLRTGIRKPKKKMSKISRYIITIKNHRLGLFALALITPSIISIPVGSILAAKYFSHDKRAVLILFIAVVFWAFILTSLVSFFDIRL